MGRKPSPLKRPSLRSIAERNALVEQWQFLPHAVWNRLKNREDIRRLGCYEVIGAAVDGLIHAAELWDPERKGRDGQPVPFPRYAFSACVKEVLKALRFGYMLSVPQSLMNVSPKNAAALAQAGRVRSLKRDEARGLRAPHQQLMEPDDRAEIRRHLKRLPAQQYYVLDARFFRHLTLKETGEELGCTKQRAKQIQDDALAHMRRLIAA